MGRHGVPSNTSIHADECGGDDLASTQHIRKRNETSEKNRPVLADALTDVSNMASTFYDQRWYEMKNRAGITAT